MEEPKIKFFVILRNIILVILLSCASIFAISWLYRGASLTSTLKAVKPIYLFVALGTIIANWLLEALRIQKIANMFNKDVKIKYSRILQLELMGSFLSKITPFESGGEPFLIYFLHKDKNVSLAISTSIVLIKVIFSHFARLALGIFIPVFVIVFKSGWKLSPKVNLALNIGLGIYLLYTFMLILLFFKSDILKPIITYFFSLKFIHKISPKKIDRFLQNVNKFIEDYKKANEELFRLKPNDLLVIAGYSFLCWILIFLVPVFLLYGMGIKSPIVHILTIIIFFQLASAYGPTPGSSGFAELGFAALFSVIVPHSVLFVFVIMWRIITYYLYIFVGGVLAIKEFLFKRKKI